MYLQKLTIYNFRSYYGKKEFVFSRHLNLILGSNGDGKSTFFDALGWALTPDYALQRGEDGLDETSLVSAKMFRELSEGQQGRVLVAVELRNNGGQLRIIERSFNVTKRPGGGMKIEGRAHKAFQQVGMKRKEFFSVKDVLEKENVFPKVIMKYHLFKGEEKLNVFDDKTTLETLINMFSDVKDFGPYKDFVSHAQGQLREKVEKIKKKEGQALAQIASSRNKVIEITKQLDQAEAELARAKREHKEAAEKIAAIDSDYEIVRLVDEKEKEMRAITHEIERIADKIDERYSIKLLDNQWILMGFKPILQEFNRKLESLKESKDNIEYDYRKKQEDEYTQGKIEQAKNELEKIAWQQSDVDRMKNMMHTHRCIYCGSEAQEGSVTYDFIRQRIEDVVKLLMPKQQEKRPEIKRYFSERNIEALKEMGASLKHAGKDIDGIKDEVDSLERNNDERRRVINTRQQALNELSKEIETLYASSKTGENLKDYVTNFKEVNSWHERKDALARQIDLLQKQTIPQLKDKLESARKEQGKAAKGTPVSPLLKADEFFRLFGNAIENIEDETYTNLLTRLEKDANLYLAQLNVDDFTGTIKIELDLHDQPNPVLRDKSGQEIKSPNTSLRTTMHISILLAIAKMTQERQNAEYPLIFDAPTSSFDEGKDKMFYECLNTQVDKQCIVVTKSYLYKNEEGLFVIDKKALDRLNCKKFRIRKKAGFDKLDITTIDTEVEEIKED